MLTIIGVLLSYVVPICVVRINRAKYDKMINEMTSIAQASIDYYNAQYHDPKNPNASWPPDINHLAPLYMFQPVIASPWGSSYVLSTPGNSINSNDLAQVSTIIPSGIAENNSEGSMVNVTPVGDGDQISITLSVTNEGLGMAQYEKKYLYNNQ